MPEGPRRGSAPEGDGAAFEDEERDGLEDLATGAPALRFGRDLRLLEVICSSRSHPSAVYHPLTCCRDAFAICC